MSTLDAEALATLTQEERDAINGEEYTPENKEALARIAANASDDDEDDEGDDPQDGGAPVEGAAAKTDPAPAKTDEPAAAQDADPAPKPTPAAPVAQYSAELPADYADKVAELETRRAKIEADFEAGEFDTAEQRRLLAELSKDRDELLVVKARAETLQSINDSNRQSAQQAFEAAFVARVKGDGVDYSQAKNQRLFNTMLEDLREDNPEQTEAWFWENAHAAVLRSRGIAPAAAKTDPTPAPAKDPVAAAVAARKAPIDAAPKTLAQVPGSDGPGDVHGEFADLDALEGLELEDAIRRMTPAQREKYAKG